MQSFLQTTFTRFLRSPQRHTAVLTKLVDVQGHWMTNQRNMSAHPHEKLKSIDNLIIKKGATLPYITNVKGVGEVRIEYITEKNGEDAWRLLKTIVEEGAGYSTEEVEPLDEFLHNAETGRKYFQMVDQTNNTVICPFIYRRCPVARSETPIHYSWFVAGNPDYRNKGLGLTYARVSSDLGRSILGHAGVTVARAALSRGVHVVQHSGCDIIGIIPNCSKLEGTGRMADIIFSTISKTLISEDIKKIPEPELPPLVVSDVVPTSLQSDKPPLTNFPPLAMNEDSLDVDVASSQDVWRVEEMIRQAAQKGEGFGLDEFNAEGHFNRALLYDSHVVTVKNKDDSIVAAAIFGPTKLCRAFNPIQVGGYILVNEEYRRKGVGNAFTKYLIKHARAAGYKYILTDVYCMNIPGQRIMQSIGFSITGSMPHCGYMKGQGYTDSLVHYLSMAY